MRTWFEPENITSAILDRKGPQWKITPPAHVTWFFEVDEVVYKYKIYYGFHAQHGWKPSVPALKIWLTSEEKPEWLNLY